MNVLIPGGSGGIGSATARAVALRGAWPIIGYCVNRTAAESIIRQIGCGDVLHLDFRGRCDLAGVTHRLIDAVVYCAGMASAHASLTVASDAEIDSLLAVHALGPLRMTLALAAAGQLRTAIFVLSTAALQHTGGPYALSKAAGLMVARQLQRELSATHTAVHGVAPGWTETAMASFVARTSGRDLADIRADHLDGRLLLPDEVGDLCADLAMADPMYPSGRLVCWDRRTSRTPRWLDLNPAPTEREMPA